MTKVYILQDNPFDPKNFIQAEEYGEISHVFNSYVAPLHLSRAYGQLYDRLRGMDKDDWIIPTGSPALIALAGSVIMEKFGKINILVWDNQNKTYIPVKVKKDGIGKLIKQGQETSAA